MNNHVHGPLARVLLDLRSRPAATSINRLTSRREDLFRQYHFSSKVVISGGVSTSSQRVVSTCVDRRVSVGGPGGMQRYEVPRG